MKLQQQHVKLTMLITSILAIAVFGGLVAYTTTRLMTVNLKSHIQICKKNEKGVWEILDEVGPANLSFDASFLDLTDSKKVSSQFIWRTKSKKGRPYSVRLLKPANVAFNPANGQFKAELIFEVTYDGKKANVPGKLTTESLTGPLGRLKGDRVSGLFGVNRSSMTLVSVNKYQPEHDSPQLMLICREAYTFTPK